MVLEFKKNDVVVFDGDSLTRRSMSINRNDWPYLRMMNWDKSYADLVEELVFSWRPELDIKFFNTAIGGSTCKNLLSRYDECVLPLKPNWVIATVGTNDSVMESIEGFIVSLYEYLRIVKEFNNAKVLLLGGFKACSNYLGDAAFKNALPYYEALKQIAQETGNYYLDIGEVLFNKSHILYQQSECHTVYSDGLHFNKLGNNIIAGEVLKFFGIIK